MKVYRGGSLLFTMVCAIIAFLAYFLSTAARDDFVADREPVLPIQEGMDEGREGAWPYLSALPGDSLRVRGGVRSELGGGAKNPALTEKAFVLDAWTEGPIAGAVLEWRDERGIVQVRRTDDDGAVDLPAGSEVSIASDGYLPRTLLLGDALGQVEVPLWPTATVCISVHGLELNVHGGNVSMSWYSPYRPGDRQAYRLEVRGGELDIPAVPMGLELDLKLTVPGYAVWGSQRVALQRRERIEVHLSAECYVRGLCLDSAGNPIEGVGLSLRQGVALAGSPPTRRRSSGQGGRFFFDGLVPGVYELQARSQSGWRSSVVVQAGHEGSDVEVIVEEVGRGFSGFVQGDDGDPRIGVTVRLTSDSGTFVAHTDAQGWFRFDRYQSSKADFFEVGVGFADGVATRVIQMGDGRIAAGAYFVVEDVDTIDLVADDCGGVVSQLVVRSTPAFGRELTEKVDISEDSEFSLEPGMYVVESLSNSGEVMHSEQVFVSTAGGAAADLMVGGCPSQDCVGEVVSVVGEPISGARVELLISRGNLMTVDDIRYSGIDGRFSFDRSGSEFFPPVVTLRASAPGWVQVQGDVVPHGVAREFSLKMERPGEILIVPPGRECSLRKETGESWESVPARVTPEGLSFACLPSGRYQVREGALIEVVALLPGEKLVIESVARQGAGVMCQVADRRGQRIADWLAAMAVRIDEPGLVLRGEPKLDGLIYFGGAVGGDYMFLGQRAGVGSAVVVAFFKVDPEALVSDAAVGDRFLELSNASRANVYCLIELHSLEGVLVSELLGRGRELRSMRSGCVAMSQSLSKTFRMQSSGCGPL